MGPGPAPAAPQPAEGPAQPCPHLPVWCHAPRSAAARSVPPLGQSRSSAALGRAWNTARRRRLDSKAEEAPHISRDPHRATGRTTPAAPCTAPCLLSRGTQSHWACCPMRDLALLRRICSVSLWVGSSATSTGHCSRPGKKVPICPHIP